MGAGFGVRRVDILVSGLMLIVDYFSIPRAPKDYNINLYGGT